MTICIIDTSVFCNILDVPGRNEHRASALEALAQYPNDGVALPLPVAAVFATGKHVAHLDDGRLRRATATRFADEVRKAISGDAPWTPTPLPDNDVLRRWLDTFPDEAMRGLSLADLSIIDVFNRQCELNPARRVFIWSYDRHLEAYDRAPPRRRG